jgi:hypothetical protein
MVHLYSSRMHPCQIMPKQIDPKQEISGMYKTAPIYLNRQDEPEVFPLTWSDLVSYYLSKKLKHISRFRRVPQDSEGAELVSTLISRGVMMFLCPDRATQ